MKLSHQVLSLFSGLLSALIQKQVDANGFHTYITLITDSTKRQHLISLATPRSAVKMLWDMTCWIMNQIQCRQSAVFGSWRKRAST